MIPWSSPLWRSLSLSTTEALVLPLTFRRLRFPASVYPIVISPRPSPGQWRWRSGSRQGPRCSTEIPSSPRLRRVAMALPVPADRVAAQVGLAEHGGPVRGIGGEQVHDLADVGGLPGPPVALDPLVGSHHRHLQDSWRLSCRDRSEP